MLFQLATAISAAVVLPPLGLILLAVAAKEGFDSSLIVVLAMAWALIQAIGWLWLSKSAVAVVDAAHRGLVPDTE